MIYIIWSSLCTAPPPTPSPPFTEKFLIIEDLGNTFRPTLNQSWLSSVLLPANQHKCIWFHIFWTPSFHPSHLNPFCTSILKNPISRFPFMHFEENWGVEGSFLILFHPFTTLSLTPSCRGPKGQEPSYDREELVSSSRLLSDLVYAKCYIRYRFLKPISKSVTSYVASSFIFSCNVNKLWNLKCLLLKQRLHGSPISRVI